MSQYLDEEIFSGSLLLSGVALQTASLNSKFGGFAGFGLSVSWLQNTIYFSITAMPKKPHFTIFAIQNFVQNIKNSCESHPWDHVCWMNGV